MTIFTESVRGGGETHRGGRKQFRPRNSTHFSPPAPPPPPPGLFPISRGHFHHHHFLPLSPSPPPASLRSPPQSRFFVLLFPISFLAPVVIPRAKEGAIPSLWTEVKRRRGREKRRTGEGFDKTRKGEPEIDDHPSPLYLGSMCTSLVRRM